MEKGCGFGELALIYNEKRSATISAVEACSTYTLDAIIFKKIIIHSSINKRNLQAGFLDQINLLSKLNFISNFFVAETLDRFQKLKLVDGLKEIEVEPGDVIIREGDQGEEFYIIEEGEVECLKLHEVSGKLGFMKVRTLESGSHFGELALINNEKRSLSVRAKSKCKLLRLDREAFTRILGSIEKNLAKDYGNEWQQRLQKMQERRNNSQTFDKNFIEIQELMKS